VVKVGWSLRLRVSLASCHRYTPLTPTRSSLAVLATLMRSARPAALRSVGLKFARSTNSIDCFPAASTPRRAPQRIADRSRRWWHQRDLRPAAFAVVARDGLRIFMRRRGGPSIGNCRPAAKSPARSSNRPDRFSPAGRPRDTSRKRRPRITGTFFAISAFASWTVTAPFEVSSTTTNFTGRPPMPGFVDDPSSSWSDCCSAFPMKAAARSNARMTLISYGAG